MDELAKALADAIKAGTTTAGPALHAYLGFRIWDDVISYGGTCGIIIVCVAMWMHTIRKCN